MTQSFIATLSGPDGLPGVYLAYTTFSEITVPGTDYTGYQSTFTDHDWLSMVKPNSDSIRIPPPVELRFDCQGTGNLCYKITVNSGAYNGRLLGLSNTGYIGAYGNPSNFLFGIKKGGVYLSEITGPLIEFEIVSPAGKALQTYGGKDWKGAYWKYIVDHGGIATTFNMKNIRFL